MHPLFRFQRATLSQIYKSAVSLSFKNVMPVYQYHHGREEVIGWYRTLGFRSEDARYPGFFISQF